MGVPIPVRLLAISENRIKRRVAQPDTGSGISPLIHRSAENPGFRKFALGVGRWHSACGGKGQSPPCL